MEIWREIPEANNYSVSSLGNIKNNKFERKVSTTPDKNGYLKIDLYINGARLTKRLHRLIADLFVDNPLDKDQVNHINGNIVDNRSSNLRWGDRNDIKKWDRELKGIILVSKEEKRAKNIASSKQYHIKYRLTNPCLPIKSKEEVLNKRKQRKKEYRIINKEHLLNIGREWRIKNPEYSKFHYEKNREKLGHKKRIKDPLFDFKNSTRYIVKNSFRRDGYKKNTKTQKIIGCSFIELKKHIESQFEWWMSWENYGNRLGICDGINQSWDIDHIVPISSAKTESEVLKLCHYTNLQPLCSYTNRWVKRNKILKLKRKSKINS